MNFLKKTTALLLIAAIALGNAADLSAQKRKAPARKTAKAQVAAPALKADKLEDCGLQVFSKFTNGYELYSYVSLKADKTAEWSFGFTELEATWSVTGNTLNVVSGSMKITASSTDGGRSFTGKLQNGKNGAGDKCVIYNNTNPSGNLDKAKSELIKGTYKSAYIMIVGPSDKPKLAFPVKVKFTPGENPDMGTYKVTSDNVTMTALGMLKGKYAFVQNMLMFKGLKDSEGYMILSSDDTGRIDMRLGQAKIPDLSAGSVWIYLIVFP